MFASLLLFMTDPDKIPLARCQGSWAMLRVRLESPETTLPEFTDSFFCFEMSRNELKRTRLERRRIPHTVEGTGTDRVLATHRSFPSDTIAIHQDPDLTQRCPA